VNIGWFDGWCFLETEPMNRFDALEMDGWRKAL